MPRPRTTSERVAASQARRLAAGWRRITLLLRPETAAALDQLRPIHGSDTATIEAAVLRLTTHLPRQP